MGQQCGQTWLQTFAEANSVYSSGNQLPYMQLVTWNDYEEATEIESGIDNCFSLTPSVSDSTLQWNISGNEDTVDHYNVYISTDGQNLMTLTQTASGDRSVNLCSFPIPAGNYQLFVQAVGKPSMANRMPGPVSYSPTCLPAATGSSSSASTSFTASPTAISIAPGQSGQVTITANSQAAPNNGTISLSCDYLPANLYCSFSPATITPGSGTATSTLTIRNGSTTAENVRHGNGAPGHAGWLLSFGALGFAFMGNRPNQRRLLVALLAFGLVGGTMLATSCGGGGGSASPSQNSSSANRYTVSVIGNSGSTQMSAPIVVNLQ